MKRIKTLLLAVFLTGFFFFDAAEGAASDGSQNITRGKFVRNAVLSLAGKVLTEFVPQTAGKFFIDVPGGSSASRYIRFAYDQGALSMPPGRLFFPKRDITRAEALKIIFGLLQGTAIMEQGTWNKEQINEQGTGSIGQVRAAPFIDVREGEWFAPYVESAIDLCLIEKGQSVFKPNGPLTDDEMTEWLQKARLIADTGTACTTSLPKITVPPVPTTESTATPMVEYVRVAIQQGFVAPSKVPKNATNIAFLKIDVTAPDTEAVVLTGVNVHRRGLGNSEELSAVKIFEGSIRHGSSRKFSKNDQIATLNLAYDPILIPKGETKTITIAGDMNADSSGGEHRFVIEDPADIKIIGQETGREIEIKGNFPLMSPEVGVSNTSAAELQIEFIPTHKRLTYGRKNVEIARIRISEESGTKKAKIRSLTLFFDNVDDNALRNLVIESGGRQLTGSLPTTSNGSAVFTFPENNLNLRGGEDATLSLKADIFVSGNTEISIHFDDLSSDILTEPEFR